MYIFFPPVFKYNKGTLETQLKNKKLNLIKYIVLTKRRLHTKEFISWTGWVMAFNMILVYLNIKTNKLLAVMKKLI